MRPHRLVMKAFGPFADETDVDFDAMGNSVYLISGETGAGKTTIFDGIIYALYGTASGGARSSLGAEAFHSDYAKDGKHRDEMRVELKFSHAGRSFTVVRRMFWGKKGDTANASREAVLSENGNTLVYSGRSGKNDEVTAKVTELLGLNADQFRRIIMLAQGEFQKFLTARSDERGEILGRLCDNRRHQDLQLRLKGAAELLGRQEKALADAAEAQIRLFAIPEDTEEALRASVAFDHPALFTAVSQIVSRMETELKELEQERSLKSEAMTQLSERKTRGLTRNRLLKDLENRKRELAEAESRQGEISALKQLTAAAVSAEKVFPAEGVLMKAERERTLILRRLEVLKAERKRLETEHSLTVSRKALVREKNEPLIKSLREQQSSLQGLLHFYDDLAAGISARDRKKREHGLALAAVSAAGAELEKKKKRQAELQEMLQKLSSAGISEVRNAERALQDVRERHKALKEIKDEIPGVRALIAKERAAAGTLEQAKEAESAKVAEHHRLYTAFCLGQAGILAQEMREQLKTAPQAVCPVCGSVHTAEDEANFAVLKENTPSGEAVDSAYELMDAAHKQRRSADDKHAASLSALLLGRASLLEKCAARLPGADWEALDQGGVLAAALSECGEALRAAEALCKKAADDKKAREAAEAEKQITDRAVTQAEAALEELRQKEKRLSAEAASAETSAENWKRQLQGCPAGKKEAEKQIASLGQECASLEKQIADEDDAYARCVTAQALNSGNLESAEAEREERERAHGEAREAFCARLEKYSFADPDAFHAAAAPEGRLLDQDALAVWIHAGQEKLEAYDRQVRELRSAVRQLEESTEGMTYTDVAELEVKIRELSLKLSVLDRRRERTASDLERDRTVREELGKLMKRRSLLLKADEKLRPLAETANGRYAFSRFVLSGFFRRILEAANVHLESMTDGEYSLIPKEGGDGRTNTGLDLKVLNSITGLERETGSLSGGQMFEASLSLALGLSDVVQMEHTGRIHIDSMFIDEGFGSLDGGRLDKAVGVLQHLSAGKRQIGIISHVARLDECLPKKIHVIAGERGSTVRIETDV